VEPSHRAPDGGFGRLIGPARSHPAEGAVTHSAIGAGHTGSMPMRQDCKNFESRSYPNGDTVRKCNLDLAPEAPWRCPDDCGSFAKRRVDVNWSHGTLITPETPDEPASLGEDGSIAALLDAAEDIINAAGPQVMADLDAERSGKGRFRRKKKGDKGPKDGRGKGRRRR